MSRLASEEAGRVAAQEVARILSDPNRFALSAVLSSSHFNTHFIVFSRILVYLFVLVFFFFMPHPPLLPSCPCYDHFIPSAAASLGRPPSQVSVASHLGLDRPPDLGSLASHLGLHRPPELVSLASHLGLDRPPDPVSQASPLALKA